MKIELKDDLANLIGNESLDISFRKEVVTG